VENEIAEKVILIVKEKLGDMVNGAQVELDTRLVDLGVNSLTFIKIVIAFEAKFNIEFGDEDLSSNKFTTIKDITTYIQEKVFIQKQGGIELR
jgi:acyl carrier protein